MRWNKLAAVTVCAFCVVGFAVAQEEDVMAPGGHEVRNISSPVFIQDAVPQPRGTMDFRLKWNYETGAEGTDDDFGLELEWAWGTCQNAELWLSLPINLGDGGWDPDEVGGNADLSFGLLYRFWEEADWLPAFAMSGELRMPTGYHSSGVEAEFRGMLTKTLVGDLRGHLNAFALTVNSDNHPDARDFQWGFLFGVDCPLTAAKDLWLIVDYMHRSSEHYGASNMNMLEAGLEWEFTEGQSLHFSTQVGLDDNEDTPNWGAKMAYTYEIRVY